MIGFGMIKASAERQRGIRYGGDAATGCVKLGNSVESGHIGGLTLSQLLRTSMRLDR